MTALTDHDAALVEAIKAFARNPASFATTDKRGKFPLAMTKMAEGGSHFDMVPLTHACTAESHAQIKALLAALSTWWQATEAGPAQ